MSATQRDAEALAWCLRHGASQELLAQFLHAPLGEDERDLLAAILDGLEPHDVAGVEVLVAAVAWPRYVDGISNLAHKVVDVTDCKALVLLVEMDGRVFCVARSRTDEVDAGAIAELLGGGGHPQAASAISREALADALVRLEQGLASAARRPVTARELMSTPARTIPPEETVARALVSCQRYAQSGILVAEDGRLVGVVAREDLDRAVAHGLSHAPVKAVMSGRAATAAPDTPVGELQSLLASGNERVAVLEGDRIARVVTRSDVLRALGAHTAPPERPGPMLTEELARLDKADVVSRCRAAVLEQLSSGEGTEEEVAKQLHMSPRTLQRKLAEANMTYLQLLDDTRKDLALRYIEDPRRSVTDITFSLGFSQPSAFTRAFKRWTGLSPTDHRTMTRRE